MTNVFIPFIILSLWSYLFVIKYNLTLYRSYLFVVLILICYLLFVGKLGFLSSSINLLNIFTVALFIFLIFKKKINKKTLQQIFILFLIYCFLIWICKDLFYYKYDEFSEYGITSKLLFSENNVPSNINYLVKGSHHKINLISFFHYFFLKNSTKLFQENITYIAHSFFILILLLNILDYVKTNLFKKFIIFIIFYFLIYALGPGLDRLYLDTIIGLIISLLLIISFKSKKITSDYYLLFLLALILPMLKPNGILILIGIIPLILFENIIKKKFIIFGIILLSLISYQIVSEFYINDMNYNKKAESSYENDMNYNKKAESSYEIHESLVFNLKQVNQLNQVKDIAINLDNEFIHKFLKSQLRSLISGGIYHSETFLILNKIISKINSNLKLIQVPLNIFTWFIIIMLITFFITLKEKDKNLYWISLLYLGFICSYYLMLIFWGIKHNLVTIDLELKVSWQRHLGSLLIGIIFFLIIKFFQVYSSFKISILFFLFTVCVSLPNSIRLYVPKDIMYKELFWKNKINQRNELGILSKEINSKINNYSNMLFAFDKNDDPYFEPILKYELIKINTISIDNINFYNKDIFNLSSKKNTFYLLKDNKYDLSIIKKYLKNLFIDKRNYKKISFIKRYIIHQLEIYEVVIEK